MGVRQRAGKDACLAAAPGNLHRGRGVIDDDPGRHRDPEDVQHREPLVAAAVIGCQPHVAALAQEGGVRVGHAREGAGGGVKLQPGPVAGREQGRVGVAGQGPGVGQGVPIRVIEGVGRKLVAEGLARGNHHVRHWVGQRGRHVGLCRILGGELDVVPAVVAVKAAAVSVVAVLFRQHDAEGMRLDPLGFRQPSDSRAGGNFHRVAIGHKLKADVVHRGIRNRGGVEGRVQGPGHAFMRGRRTARQVRAAQVVVGDVHLPEANPDPAALIRNGAECGLPEPALDEGIGVRGNPYPHIHVSASPTRWMLNVEPQAHSVDGLPLLAVDLLVQVHGERAQLVDGGGDGNRIRLAAVIWYVVGAHRQGWH